MTPTEQRLAVASLLPKLIRITPDAPEYKIFEWEDTCRPITEREWLSVASEAEKTLADIELDYYEAHLRKVMNAGDKDELWNPKRLAGTCVWHATDDQRIFAICKTLWPERFDS